MVKSIMNNFVKDVPGRLTVLAVDGSRDLFWIHQEVAVTSVAQT